MRGADVDALPACAEDRPRPCCTTPLTVSKSSQKAFTNTFVKHRDLINQALFDCLFAYPFKNDRISEAACYSVRAGGHRWRPVLFLQLYELLAARASASVVPIACSIEFVHTASIILDDLPAMDDAALRRGAKTCHLKFDQATALMAAFWLCDVAQHQLCEYERFSHKNGRNDLGERLRFTKNEMMHGQALDLHPRASAEKDILEICRLKSGALYAFTA